MDNDNKIISGSLDEDFPIIDDSEQKKKYLKFIKENDLDDDSDEAHERRRDQW